MRSGRFRPRSDRLPDGGRLAGSARNRQPWRFVVVERRELVEQAALVAVPVCKSGLDGGRAAQNMLAAWNEGVAS